MGKSGSLSFLLDRLHTYGTDKSLAYGRIALFYKPTLKLAISLLDGTVNCIYCIQTCFRYSRVIGLLNCFAAGVFLGTAMLHLLPNVIVMLRAVSVLFKYFSE